MQIVQASFEQVSIFGIDIWIAKNLFEEFLAIGFNAGGCVLGAYFFGEWEFQVFFEVPFKFLLLLLFEWVVDGNGVFGAVVEADDGVWAIGSYRDVPGCVLVACVCLLDDSHVICIGFLFAFGTASRADKSAVCPINRHLRKFGVTRLSA